MSSHTPAWKRLGLKLKYANAASPIQITPNQVSAESREFETVERPTKRQRVDKTSTAADLHESYDHQRADHLVPSNHGRGTGSLLVKGEVITTKRKKSVSFTNDTKPDDGDTRTTIDFPAGSPGSTPKKTLSSQNIDSMNAEGSPSQASVRDNKDSNIVSKPTKSKKNKKAKSKSDLKDKTTPALDYLRQHREHRSQWKFNKNRDVWILSHALDTAAIPESHLISLAGYIRGLPQTAGARSRLVMQAREALANEPTLEAGMSVIPRDAFWKLLENPGQAETKIPADIKLCSRPLLLLWALNEEVTGNDMVVNTALESGIGAQSNKVKRKSRTSAPVDISSSESESDSDTDNETSSDSEDEGLARATNLDESTSQSSSESDSSESTASDEGSSSH